MANLLYLVHRLPYPPDKGDKVRSYHLLRHLAERHRVFLGTFVDDPADEAHVATVGQWCADVCAIRLHPARARLASLTGLAGTQALTLHYYRHRALHRWVQRVAAAGQLDASVVFSSSMAQYAEGLAGVPMLVDFVDVDSAKWSQYASARRWPVSWLYRREANALLAYERRIAARARRSFFVTERETALFAGLAPEVAGAIEPLSNGVDADYFAPDPGRPSPYTADEKAIVFTGAMDYWPNADAVGWFAREALPSLRAAWPEVRFYIVGRNPTPAVQALAAGDVVVTGTVPDVRPYLQHAAAVVAPLRLARGIQNKVLEAMAMARPVVTSAACAASIDAQAGEELLSAIEPHDFVAQLDALLRLPERGNAIGRAGRACVLERYTWRAHLAGIDRHLDALPRRQAQA